MKRTNLLTILVLSGSIIFSGCASMSNTGKGAAIGAGGGAARLEPEPELWSAKRWTNRKKNWKPSKELK